MILADWPCRSEDMITRRQAGVGTLAISSAVPYIARQKQSAKAWSTAEQLSSPAWRYQNSIKYKVHFFRPILNGQTVFITAANHIQNGSRVEIICSMQKMINQRLAPIFTAINNGGTQSTKPATFISKVIEQSSAINDVIKKPEGRDVRARAGFWKK